MGFTPVVLHKCAYCLRKSAAMYVDDDGWMLWQSYDFLISDAFPDSIKGWTAGKREQLISGIHEECFDLMFPEEDDCPEPFCAFHSYGDQPCPTEDLAPTIEN